MGGTTDLDGYFKYFIPEYYYEDQLVISLVGYKTFEISIRDLVENPDQVFRLEENIIKLENVTVYAPNKILKEALTSAVQNQDLSEYYSNSGVISIIRQENQEYTLFEEVAFNFFYRGMLEGRPLVGYQPIAHRRSIDYSRFAFIQGGKRSWGIAYFFGTFTRFSLNEIFNELDSLDLDITDIIEEDEQQTYVITRIREGGSLINYYIDIHENRLKKVETISNQNQISRYIGGSPFNSSKYNRFRYFYTDTYHFETIENRLVITEAFHEVRTQYIERLTGYIQKAYKDEMKIKFFDYTPLSEQPKKYRDEFQLPLSMDYERSFWENFDRKYDHTVDEVVVTSLSKTKPLESQFEETNGKLVRGIATPKSTFNKKDQKRQAKVDDVGLFISQLISNNYKADYPPNLDWEDIPKLMEIADSKVVIDRFPRNILSRIYLEDCQVGIIAMWLIDSIRKNEGKRVRKAWYISPMPLLQNEQDRATSSARGGGNEYVPTNNEEKLEQAYQAFKSWWENSAEVSINKAKRVNPLGRSGLNWVWR